MTGQKRRGRRVEDEIRYNRDRLHVRCRGAPFCVEVSSILMVNTCVLADQVRHADEHFHLLRLRAHFWTVGPFVIGAHSALAALRNEHQSLEHTYVTVQCVPWRMRALGLLGLRLWPIAGLGRYPNIALQRLDIQSQAAQ
jgi:hypothetical protein